MREPLETCQPSPVKTLDTPLQAILSQTTANSFCGNQTLVPHYVYGNPAAVNNPFSGQSAVIGQTNVPPKTQWTPAVAQCDTGVTSDGNTNPPVGVFTSVTPISQHQLSLAQVVVSFTMGYPILTTLTHISSNVLQLIIAKK